MNFIKTIRTRSVLTGLPPLENSNDKTQTTKRAYWDVLQGFMLWQLLVRLSLNDMRRRYKRTVLGPSWMTVNLLIFASVTSVVWASLWGQNVKEFLPFLLSGLVPWTMISGVLGESTGAFLGGEGLIKNQQFPYVLLTNGVVARNALIFFHNVVGYLLVALLCNVDLNMTTLLILPNLIFVLANCGWMSLLLAIFCLRYRDMQQIVTSLIQITVFVTPIFWKADQIQGSRTIFLVHGNLFYHLIELLRRPLLGEFAGLESYLVCLFAAIVGWWFTFKLFRSKRHRLAYWF